MNALTFKGQIVSGGGSFRRMVIPGSCTLQSPPANWPQQFAPGSLNVKILLGGMPVELEQLGKGTGLQRLESGHFQPLLEIPHDLIKNNRLTMARPCSDNPQLGNAQVWVADLQIESSSLAPIRCWVLRRIGALYKNKLEIISDKVLRSAYDLQDDMPVTVVLYAGVVG